MPTGGYYLDKEYHCTESNLRRFAVSGRKWVVNALNGKRVEKQPQENEGKCISRQLEEVLAQLSIDQIRFVIARQGCPSDKEAAEAVGIKPGTVYRWPDNVKDAVHLMAHDGLVAAYHIRRRNLAKAMLVKVDGLSINDESLRQRVATEIIEWEMGKATQKQELSGPGAGEFVVNYSWDEMLEKVYGGADTAKDEAEHIPDEDQGV